MSSIGIGKIHRDDLACRNLMIRAIHHRFCETVDLDGIPLAEIIADVREVKILLASPRTGTDGHILPITGRRFQQKRTPQRSVRVDRKQTGKISRIIMHPQNV